MSNSNTEYYPINQLTRTETNTTTTVIELISIMQMQPLIVIQIEGMNVVLKIPHTSSSPFEQNNRSMVDFSHGHGGSSSNFIGPYDDEDSIVLDIDDL